MNDSDLITTTRRTFLGQAASVAGAFALGSFLPGHAAALARQAPGTHLAPRAKRVIFIFLSGGPSHLDLTDEKPLLTSRQGEQLPDSVRQGQRLTGMTSGQSSLPLVGSPFPFRRYGECGMNLSTLLPHIGSVADDLCLIRSMYTEPINHDPAATYLMTGHQVPGLPSMGAWVSYGLPAANPSLPEFVVMLSGREGQPLHQRYWHNGFLPGEHQGVAFRSQGDPVLYLTHPARLGADARATLLNGVMDLNQMQFDDIGHPDILASSKSQQLAVRLQQSMPDIMDFAGESPSTLAEYGVDGRQNSFAVHCLMARRLAERGVRFIQLCHRGFDHHERLPSSLRNRCTEIDRPSAALLRDLKQRGLLEDTLVIWSGEFGRTAYCQGPITARDFGRDHHPRCFSSWMAGGGVKQGLMHGETDEFGYNIVSNPVHVHDFQATVLHLLGLDHTQLTAEHQGRDVRLTDVGGRVVHELVA